MATARRRASASAGAAATAARAPRRYPGPASAPSPQRSALTWPGPWRRPRAGTDHDLTCRLSPASAEHVRHIESAIEKAKEIAGDKVVGVNGGTIARQTLDAGLLAEIWVDLVPVLLGGGTPFFEQLKDAPVVLEGPTSIVEGVDVTHLRYRVRKAG